MPITIDYTLPASTKDLVFPPNVTTFFIAFLASPHPETKVPWCPDVVAALPTLNSTFSGVEGPHVAFVNVGQRPEWKDPSNEYRTVWNVHSVPTLVRYEEGEGVVKEVGRLVEGEILDEKRLQSLVSA